MLLVYLTGSFAKVALICLVVWFATNVADNLLLLDFAVVALQMILVFEWFLIFLIFSLNLPLSKGIEDSTRLALDEFKERDSNLSFNRFASSVLM